MLYSEINGIEITFLAPPKNAKEISERLAAETAKTLSNAWNFTKDAVKKTDESTNGSLTAAADATKSGASAVGDKLSGAFSGLWGSKK